jgi:hypothetical protein
MRPSISEKMAPALPLAVLLVASGAADAQPASTFQASCRHIRIAGSTVSAECRRNNGSYKPTWLRIAGVENLNGTLHYTTVYRVSTFQDSCKDITIAGAAISALCLREDGSLAKSWIAIPDMVNKDGDLRYGPAPPPRT